LKQYNYLMHWDGRSLLIETWVFKWNPRTFGGAAGFGHPESCRTDSQQYINAESRLLKNISWKCLDSIINRHDDFWEKMPLDMGVSGREHAAGDLSNRKVRN
jgi:hypothetical protein